MLQTSGFYLVNDILLIIKMLTKRLIYKHNVRKNIQSFALAHTTRIIFSHKKIGIKMNPDF